MEQHCFICSAVITDDSKFCQNCGNALSTPSVPSVTCPRCGRNYSGDEKYCIEDGSTLVPEHQLQRQCVICHATYPDGVNFCPVDGGAISRSDVNNSGIYPINYSLQSYGGTFPKADLGLRFAARLLDVIFFLLLCIPSLFLYLLGRNAATDFDSGTDGDGFYLLAILFYLIPLTYAFIKDGLGRGQSWGKRICSLMVIGLSDNLSCTKGQSLIRNLISGLIALVPIVGWFVEPIMVFATSDGRKVGDNVAHTQVVETKYYNSI